MKYDQRELAADAVPFCSKLDDVIPGDHGLASCVAILSDRINALTPSFFLSTLIGHFNQQRTNINSIIMASPIS
jgi:hypothetical protein